MWDYIAGIVFFTLILLAGLGIKALLVLVGVPAKVAGVGAIIGGIFLVLGVIAVACLVSDGIIKIKRNK